MTIGDLRRMIAGLSDSAPLVMTRCSDFQVMEEGDVSVVDVVRQQGGAYYRRGKPELPGEVAVKALYFDGN